MRFAASNKLLVAAVLATCAAAASAHRPWLLPSSTMVDGDAPVVTVDAAISEDLFRFDSFPLQVDDLIVTGPDGARVPTSSRSAAKRRTTFDIALPKKGTYRIAGVTDGAFASWKVNGETKRWRGAPDGLQAAVPADAQDLQVTRMRGRAETFVSYDSASAAPAAPTDGLAVQPLTSPTDLSAGDTSRFVLTLDGKPLADADVTLVRGGNRYRYKIGEVALKTGADGTFSVTWPEAGEWWLGVNHGGRGAGGTVQAPAQRASYSATFEVLPK
jgi:uncharacterized GH25 family protein